MHQWAAAFTDKTCYFTIVILDNLLWIPNTYGFVIVVRFACLHNDNETKNKQTFQAGKKMYTCAMHLIAFGNSKYM